MAEIIPTLMKLSSDQFIIKFISPKMVLVTCVLDGENYWASIQLINKVLMYENTKPTPEFKPEPVYGAYVKTTRTSKKTGNRLNILKELKV